MTEDGGRSGKSGRRDEASVPRRTDRFGFEPSDFLPVGIIVLLSLVWLAAMWQLGIVYDPDFASVFVSGLTPIVVLVLGFAFDQRLRRRERRHKERIEFTIDANVHGPKEGFYLCEFVIYVHNKSRVKHSSDAIVLWVRALERGEQPTPWERPRTEGRGNRVVDFPCKVVDDVNVIPKDMRPIFVEPDVKQPITYVVRIETRYDYVLAHAEFNYTGKRKEDGFQPHSVERLFALPPAEES